MQSLAKKLLLLSCLMAPWVAHAEIFICKDASGRTISSDRPIPECAGRAMRELGRNGLVKREIAAPLTPEEKRQKQLQEEKQKADAAAAEEQKKSDRAIMTRYSSEKDVEMARKRSLEPIQEQIKRANASITNSEKQLKQGQAEVENYKKKGAKPPVELRNRIELAEQSIKDEAKLIQGHEAEIAKINTNYDQTLKRYREITGVTAAK
jgi:hypothetical protein